MLDPQELYEISVQDAQGEVGFLSETFRQTRKTRAFTFREDFCGTFLNSVCWVQSDRRRCAIAVDKDAKVIHSGKKRHLNDLSTSEKSRIKLHCQDVLSLNSSGVDILAALNFSICYFHGRAKLLDYLSKSYASLSSKGMMFVDLLGGTEVEISLRERRLVKSKKYGNFHYVWEQVFFNPLDRKIRFSIHFQLKNKKTVKNAFTYDWRLWTIPEIVEAMKEVGFKETRIYWEGEDKRGMGTGIFQRATKAENCQIWVAYVVGIK